MATKTKRISPVHPGEILCEEFLDPIALSAYRLAKDINVPLTRIAAILNGKRAITAETDLRLTRYFGLSRGFWLRLQAHYDMDVAVQEVGSRIEKEVKPRAA